jgi:hypothetical protein
MHQEGMSKATCVNAAISATNEPLILFCTGIDAEGRVIPGLGFSQWCLQTCTTNKTKLYTPALNPTFSLVDKYMQEHHVQGMSVQSLLDKHAKGRKIRAIQIDVEGLDDMVSSGECP